MILPAELRVGTSTTPGVANDYGRAIDEYRQFFRLGVEGPVQRHPDTGLEAREQFLSESR